MNINNVFLDIEATQRLAFKRGYQAGYRAGLKKGKKYEMEAFKRDMSKIHWQTGLDDKLDNLRYDVMHEQTGLK